MSASASRLFARTDLLRVAGWICANAIAGLLSGQLLDYGSPLVGAGLFGVILGLLQSAAVGRSWPEALGWAAMTVMGLTGATMVVSVLLFEAVFSSLGAVWIVAAVLGLLLGIGMGLAQGVVFTMRDLPRRSVLLWTSGSALAGAIVGASAFVGPIAQPSGALRDLVTTDVARTIYGLTFGLLTAVPLTVVLIEARAAEG